MADSQGKTRWTRDAITGLVSILVILVLIFLGVSLTQANSDYVCNDNSINTQQQGACTDGSWSPWTDVNGINQRTYTGTQTTVSYTGGNIVSCSHPTDNSNGVTGTTGTITTTYTACEIEETQPAGGVDNTGDNSGNNTGSSTNGITQTETVGAVINSSSSTASYDYYQAYVSSLLATSSLSVVPQLVKAGETTQVMWTSTDMASCVVSATNGDTWTALQSPVSGETSSPINGQVTYSLSCTNEIGATPAPQTVVVDVVPTFQEQ